MKKVIALIFALFVIATVIAIEVIPSTTVPTATVTRRR